MLMKDIFSRMNRTKTILEIEAALARVQAGLGIIPHFAAEEITRKADIQNIPADMLEEEIHQVGHPLVALINVWVNSMENNAGEYLHYGATTSDIYDTMHVIHLRSAAAIILNDLTEIEDILLDMAQKHKNTVMVGRTLGQHALPITFGLKAAKWATENRRNIQRLKECMMRINSGILSGAVDTYAGLGEKAFETEALLMKELSLGLPEPVGWHGDRDKFVEFGNTIALIGMTFGKIGLNLFLLQSTDVGEVEENMVSTSVGSSTMPQKNNPRKSRVLVILSREIRRHVEVLQDWMTPVYERDQISHEGQLQEICIKADTLLKTAKELLKNLIVKPDSMLLNLNKTDGLIMSEKVMFLLEKEMGKHTAHHVVRKIAMRVSDRNISFKNALLENPDVKKCIPEEEFDTILDPSNYIGLSEQAVSRTIEAIRKMRAEEPSFD